MDSLYVHCDLAADAHAVGNVRSCLLHAVPVEGHSCQVMCYKPWWLDWLSMCWTELKDVHLLMMNSHDQKVPCEGCVCSVKLLMRRRVNTFRSEREREMAQPGSAQLQPNDTSAWSPAGGPTSNLAMETSSPDKQVCHKWVPHARLVRMSL